MSPFIFTNTREDICQEEFLMLHVEALILTLSQTKKHIIYGNIYDDKVTKYKTTTMSEQSQQGTNERRHFMNYCLTHPGKFSCAVDSFLELNFAIFKDSLKHINCNEFFYILFDACVQLENYDVQTDMTIVREPV